MFDRLGKIYDAIVVREDTDIEKRSKQVKKIAKAYANMQQAIKAAPTENIKLQLHYRLSEGIYEFEDLVDPNNLEKDNYSIKV